MAEPLVDPVKKQDAEIENIFTEKEALRMIQDESVFDEVVLDHLEVANNTLRGSKNASQVQDESIFDEAIQEVENKTSRGEEDPLEMQDEEFDEATLRFYKAEMENNLREEAVWQMMQDESVFKPMLTQHEVETFLGTIMDASKEQDERSFYEATITFLTLRVINDMLRGDKEAFQQNFTKLDILNEEFERKLEQLQMLNEKDEMKNLKFSKFREELNKKVLEAEKKVNRKEEELDKLRNKKNKTNRHLMKKENELAKLSDQFLDDMGKLIQLNNEYLERSRNRGLRRKEIIQLNWLKLRISSTNRLRTSFLNF